MEKVKAMDEMALLQQIPLFADVPQENLRILVGALNRRTYRKGQLILQQGEEGESLFVIVSGRVRIYSLSPDGFELSFGIYGDGDFFGEMALLTGAPRSASAEAMEETQVLVLHRGDFHSHLLSNPLTAIRVIEALSHRLRETSSSAEELLSLSVTQRIARKLLDLAERYGVQDSDGILIDLDLSQEAIASLAGTTRESANRTLSQMRHQGILDVDRVRIRLRRPADLASLLT